MKTSYHPSLVVAFYLNCLPNELQQHIPRSTRFDWRNKDKSTYFGHDWYCQNKQLFQTLQQISASKKLLLIVICLLRVIAIKKFITSHAVSIKRNRSTVCDTVLANIGKVTPVLGLSKTLRLLQMPYKAYLKLKKANRCKQSI
jgi:putative transposase